MSEATFDRSPRACGALMHITSLPASFACGDLGPASHRFARRLAESGQTWWQTLPVGPTGKGFSPYAAQSSFAGGVHLVSLELLAQEGWLREDELPEISATSQVDVAGIATKTGLLALAAQRFLSRATAAQRSDLQAFCESQSWWLDDWAFFAALARAEQTSDWTRWPKQARRREPGAMREAAHALREEIMLHQVEQYFFQRQWEALVAQCRAAGVRLMGDVPFYPALPSADVWSRQELFDLDDDGMPSAVAGVPPDYFSEIGQIWESPLYEWEAHQREQFDWWARRFGRAAALFDAVRIDHFIGMHRGWRVPIGAATAERGEWIEAPGHALLSAVQSRLPTLEIVAEDLGLLTPEAESLRDAFHFPGMRVIQFAFDEPRSAHWPERYIPNCVAYTGTHDNNTTRGWVEALVRDEASAPTLRRACELLDTDPAGLPLKMIEAVMGSVARIALLPAQDALLLDAEARMNTPGLAEGNWRWRLAGIDDFEEGARRLQQWSEQSRRTPEFAYARST